MNFNQDFFALFNLPRRFALDRSALDTAYRQIQGEVHPDRFAARPDAERRLALQWATQVNEAYQTLRQPLARARYLLSLSGVDTAEDSNTAMPAEFLMLQMEWREAIMGRTRRAGCRRAGNPGRRGAQRRANPGSRTGPGAGSGRRLRQRRRPGEKIALSGQTRSRYRRRPGSLTFLM